jgi:hypothetical protein
MISKVKRMKLREYPAPMAFHSPHSSREVTNARTWAYGVRALSNSLSCDRIRLLRFLLSNLLIFPFFPTKRLGTLKNIQKLQGIMKLCIRIIANILFLDSIRRPEFI